MLDTLVSYSVHILVYTYIYTYEYDTDVPTRRLQKLGILTQFLFHQRDSLPFPIRQAKLIWLEGRGKRVMSRVISTFSTLTVAPFPILLTTMAREVGTRQVDNHNTLSSTSILSLYLHTIRRMYSLSGYCQDWISIPGTSHSKIVVLWYLKDKTRRITMLHGGGGNKLQGRNILYFGLGG